MIATEMMKVKRYIFKNILLFKLKSGGFVITDFIKSAIFTSEIAYQDAFKTRKSFMNPFLYFLFIHFTIQNEPDGFNKISRLFCHDIGFIFLYKWCIFYFFSK